MLVFALTLCFCLIFDSAADICDLKIIKDVAEAKLLVTAFRQQYNKKANDAQTVANHRQDDRHISPKAQDKSIVSFQHSLPHIAPTNSANTEGSKRPNGTPGFKSSSSASPRKSLVKTAASRGLNGKKSQNAAAVDSRSSPYKTQMNGYRQLNGTTRVKGDDAGRIAGCSPSDLSARMQTLTVSDETVNTADCFSENNQRNVLRKRTNSGMVSVKHMPLNFSRNYCTFSNVSVSI